MIIGRILKKKFCDNLINGLLDNGSTTCNDQVLFPYTQHAYTLQHIHNKYFHIMKKFEKKILQNFVRNSRVRTRKLLI